MTQEIHRVIVPIDVASETGAAIDTAARLAARWRVSLHGVFIEDEELIGLASLPFARQVTLGAGVEPLTKDRVEDHFRAFAERARREFAAAAERHDVKWSFASVRGPLVPDMVGGEHDFVVAGAASVRSAATSESRRAAGPGRLSLRGLFCWQLASGKPGDRSSPCCAVAIRNQPGRSTSPRRSPDFLIAL